MSKGLSRVFAAAQITLAVISLSSAAYSQQIASTNLPDSPGTTALYASELTGVSSSLASTADLNAASSEDAQAVAAHQDKQSKRILGVFPNFRSVTADEKLPPQSVKEKFVTASEDSFDYSAVALPLALAGEAEATTSTPEFHGGAAGFGRYFWHQYTDQTIENYMVEFVIPAIRHEDSRYYTLGQGGFLKRAGYAARHVVVTRSDAGNEVFNSGEVVGSGVSALISNLYYPSAERTAGNTVKKWGTSVGIDVFSFALREFWPDINHYLFHGDK